MFFLNHDLSEIVIDFDSITNKQEFLSHLDTAAPFFSRVFLLSKDGKTATQRIVSGLASGALATKANYFPEAPDDFYHASVALHEFLQSGTVKDFNVVFITETESNCDTIEAAHNYAVGTILYCKHVTKKIAACGADQVIKNWEHLSHILEGEYLGYIGEISVAHSVAPRKKSPALGYLMKIENERLPVCPIYVGGRYLKMDDPTFKRHVYSKRLLHAKNNPAVDATFFCPVVNSILSSLESAAALTKFRVTYVPKKPSQPIDRLKLLFGATRYNVEELLICTRDFAPQKSVSGQFAKTQNVRGAFSLINGVNVEGQNIVVIDDITTSFSTLTECATVLLKAKAASVTLLALAVTVSHSDVSLLDLPCENCFLPMVVRFNQKNGNPFWACSDLEGFKKGQRHRTFTLEDGFKKIRNLEKTVLTSDDDIPF